MSPGAQQVAPVLEQTTNAIGALTGNLQRLDAILGDVSRISKTAGNATTAVGDAAESIASKAKTLFSRGRAAARASMPASGETARVEPTYAEVADAAPDGVEVVDADPGYFTYPEDGADEARTPRG